MDWVVAHDDWCSLISKGINRHLLIPLQTMFLLSLILMKMLLESIDLLDLKLYG